MYILFWEIGLLLKKRRLSWKKKNVIENGYTFQNEFTNSVIVSIKSIWNSQIYLIAPKTKKKKTTTKKSKYIRETKL